MTGIYSVGRIAVGAYMTYSGVRGITTRSENKSYSYEVAKVALGAAILGHQIDVLTGGQGLENRVISLIGNTAQKASEAPTASQPAFLMGSVGDKEFDPLRCDLDFLRKQLNRPESADLKKLFDVVEKTHGVSCDNHLPSLEHFVGAVTPKLRINPEYIKKPVVWGIDSLKRPFVAFKYSCDKVHQYSAAFVQFQMPDSKIWITSPHYDMRCMLPAWDPSHHTGWLTKLFLEGRESTMFTMSTYLA